MTSTPAPRPSSEQHRLPIDRLLAEASTLGAHLVHLEPRDSGGLLRIKTHRRPVVTRTLARDEYAALWQNIADRFGADRVEPFFEGSFPVTLEGGTHIVRVSMIPTPLGDSVTLKLNAEASKLRDLQTLGMAHEDLERYWQSLRKARGLIILSGPPGSGVTTTFLATLAALSKGDARVVSIEDPIEVRLPAVQQIQVKVVPGCPDRSITFDKALRAASRVSPDVIAFGLLRDAEAAHSALGAALSGSLVVSRIHAASATLALARMVNLGIAPTLLADTVRTVLCQALVERNCRACSRPVDAACVQRVAPGFPAGIVLEDGPRRSDGCDRCHRTGRVEPTALFEVLPMDATMASLIAGAAPGAEVEAHAISMGMRSIARQVRALVSAGEVPLEEYVRWC